MNLSIFTISRFSCFCIFFSFKKFKFSIWLWSTFWITFPICNLNLTILAYDALRIMYPNRTLTNKVSMIILNLKIIHGNRFSSFFNEEFHNY